MSEGHETLFRLSFPVDRGQSSCSVPPPACWGVLLSVLMAFQGRGSQVSERAPRDLHSLNTHALTINFQKLAARGRLPATCCTLAPS